MSKSDDQDLPPPRLSRIIAVGAIGFGLFLLACALALLVPSSASFSREGALGLQAILAAIGLSMIVVGAKVLREAGKSDRSAHLFSATFLRAFGILMFVMTGVFLATYLRTGQPPGRGFRGILFMPVFGVMCFLAAKRRSSRTPDRSA